jgi:hypothetical protein
MSWRETERNKHKTCAAECNSPTNSSIAAGGIIKILAVSIGIYNSNQMFNTLKTGPNIIFVVVKMYL